MRFAIPPVLLIAIASLVACNEPVVTQVSYQRQRIDDVTFRAVFDAAEHAVSKDFRISSRNPETGIVIGDDVDTEFRSDDMRPLGDTLGTQLRARRRAEVRVRQQDSSVEIHCRVHFQENTTDTVRMVNRERGVNDQPYDTPIDRDAGTTHAQNTVWRNRRRDRAAEQDILKMIRSSVGGTVAPTNGP